jgi:hypothetical protein
LGEAWDFRSELRIYPALGYGVGVMGNETAYDTGNSTSMMVSTPTHADVAMENT